MKPEHTEANTITAPSVGSGDLLGAQSVRKPYRCVMCEGRMISPRSKYYAEGVCFMCIRLDSRGGAYREYSRKKHRGLHAFRGRDGKTTHLG